MASHPDNKGRMGDMSHGLQHGQMLGHPHGQMGQDSHGLSHGMPHGMSHTIPPHSQMLGGHDSEVDSEDGHKRSGRRKILIEFIEDKSRRHITFSKRKAGIMKKAYELSTLTGTQVLLLVASETGHVYTFATPKLQPLITKPEGKNLIQSCLNAPDSGLPTIAAGPSQSGPQQPQQQPQQQGGGGRLQPYQDAQQSQTSDVGAEQAYLDEERRRARQGMEMPLPSGYGPAPMGSLYGMNPMAMPPGRYMPGPYHGYPGADPVMGQKPGVPGGPNPRA